MSADVLGAIAEADLAPLAVAADLTLSVEGERVRVTARTDELLVEIPSMRLALALARRSGRFLRAVAGVLAAVDLSAAIVIEGTGVAILGADADPGVLARRVGPHVEFRNKELARMVLAGLLDR